MSALSPEPLPVNPPVSRATSPAENLGLLGSLTEMTTIAPSIGGEQYHRIVAMLHDRTPAQTQILDTCLDLAACLISKNRKYGNSALAGTTVFAKGLDAPAKIRVRLDDKVSRIISAQSDDDEDPLTDMLGYLILLTIAEGRKIGDGA